MLLARQVTCREFSDCYDDVGICLWTDGSQLTQSAAETACQQRNNSFLPHVTDSNIQDKLAVFRAGTYDRLFVSGFWIDVKSVGVSSRFHWIGGSSFCIRLLVCLTKCFHVISIYRTLCKNLYIVFLFLWQRIINRVSVSKGGCNFSWRCRARSNCQQRTFCCHYVRHQHQEVRVLCKTLEQPIIIIHLSTTTRSRS